MSVECTHYTRNCSLVSPCCQKVYPCRVCHDDAENHILDRKLVNEVVCRKCGTRTPVSGECGKCATVFGEAYFCPICRLYDNVAKGQFHCDGCTICRVGGREKYEHCDVCEMCMPRAGTHKCIEKSSRSNCPVCFESIHSARMEAYIPPCGHLIHMPCYTDMLRKGLYSCPSCGKAMQDMRRAWYHIDREILETPMPAEYSALYREVLCKDCSRTSTAAFHVVGMKCGGCGGYNTSVEGPFLKQTESGFVPLGESELQTLYTVPLPGMSFLERQFLATLRLFYPVIIEALTGGLSSLLALLNPFNPAARLERDMTSEVAAAEESASDAAEESASDAAEESASDAEGHAEAGEEHASGNEGEDSEDYEDIDGDTDNDDGEEAVRNG